ncbi:MAG: cytochrome d ubiquinol oxidase subunit II [Arsenophonus endosymbiont of Ceratovacuna japonica]
MFDYEILRFISWLLISILFIGFVVTDGFDMGVGILLLFIGKTDIERRIMINTIAPHWDGNQVWLVTAAGAIFAAWPIVYAAAFSGFYIAMILVLALLLFRPISFDYRSKLENPKWRKIWDCGIFIGSFFPPLIIGIIFGNLLQGVPFTINEQLYLNYTGSFFSLFNFYSLLFGIFAIIMLMTQGANYLQMRTVGKLYLRSRNIIYITAFLNLIIFAIASIWLIYRINGYVIKSIIDTNADSNPMHKEVIREFGSWLINFNKYPILWIFPFCSLIFPIFNILFTKLNKVKLSFLFSSLTIISIILTFGISMFPFIMPSSIQPNVSLTIWDSSSSLFTLQVITVIAIIFIPIILSYTIWCYYKMFGKIDKIYIESNEQSLY